MVGSGSRLRRGIGTSSRRRLLGVCWRAEFLRQEQAVELFLFLKLGSHFDIRGGLWILGTEAHIIDGVAEQLGVHSLWSARVAGF